MCKFGRTRLRQLLAVKLTAAFSKSCTIDVLPYHCWYRMLSDREYSTEDTYKVCSCPLVVRRDCRCGSPLHHKRRCAYWWWRGTGAVQGCTLKDPGVKYNYIRGRQNLLLHSRLTRWSCWHAPSLLGVRFFSFSIQNLWVMTTVADKIACCSYTACPPAIILRLSWRL